MKRPPPLSPASAAADWLRRGHQLEAEGTPAALGDAIAAYDEVIALLAPQPLDGPDGVRRDLGGAWMNRANALQKRGSTAALREAIENYDRALDYLRGLPVEDHAPHRNCFGCCWLNRGHALLQLPGADTLAAAVASYESALAQLALLPFEEIAAYRLNLAGARVNLANALLLLNEPDAAIRAHAEAGAALFLVAGREAHAAEFTDLGLKARRARCDALGRMLVSAGADEVTLADEAGDLVDDALSLARRWEERDVPHFRPIAARLFRFGTELYRIHQPHFLAEFILENIAAPYAPAAWRTDAGFREVAVAALQRAQTELHFPPVLVAGEPKTERALALHRDLAAAAAQLARAA